MRLLIASWAVLLAAIAVAGEPPRKAPAKEVKVQQTDRYGNVQHHKPSWVVKPAGRIVEVSPYGQTLPHKQQFVVKGDGVYAVDSTGQIQHHKPSFSVGKDGRVIPNDAYGKPQYHKPQYHKPQYVLKDATVYRADTVGRPNTPEYEIKKK